MEDPTVHVFSLNSKKSVLSDGSSIDAEEEVVEISRPFNWSLNSKSLKQKKVILSEIIDVDMEEDCGKVKSSVGYSGKGKEVLVNGVEHSKKKPNDVIIIDDIDNRSSLRKKSRSSCATPGTPNDEQHIEAVNRLRLFKKFDSVQDHSDHHYSKQAYSVNAQKNWAKKIQEEWRILEKDLPDTIFVRVYEARMDLLRAVIMGAEGTPYHDGLFFFDVFFPTNYPNVPPHVYYHSFGLRLNPNLYACGKVCLSLLNTWNGSGKEKWIPGVSTMLQVLVSIQGLILNVKPYFNEPGYACTAGTPAGEESSLKYNESTYILNLRTMIYTMNRPPKHFEDLVSAHFLASAQDILEACKTYMDGVQVGSLVKGGIQDVDESNKSCSQNFKASLVRFIKTLIDTFTKNGAKGCGKFLYLAQK